MTTKILISKATNPPSRSTPVGLRSREGLGVRSTEKAVEMMKLTKRQIEVTMFAAGAGTLESLQAGKLVHSAN